MMQLSVQPINLIGTLLGEEYLLIIGIIVFLSYVIISFLTWSLVKPIKYIGISFTIVGAIMFIIRFGFSFLFDATIKIPDGFYAIILRPFLKMALSCLSIGVLLILIYNLLNNALENKRLLNMQKKKEEPETVVQPAKEDSLNVETNDEENMGINMNTQESNGNIE